MKRFFEMEELAWVDMPSNRYDKFYQRILGLRIILVRWRIAEIPAEKNVLTMSGKRVRRVVVEFPV